MQSIFANLRQSFRKKRYDVINQIIQTDSKNGLVLDLGGGPASFFAERYPRKNHIILVEVEEKVAQRAKRKIPDLLVVIANGEMLPFADGAIEITVCNSVIEHVENPPRLAAEIQRVSQSYFVQTPNGRFPLETHSFIGIPFYNWIPTQPLKKLACRMFGANYRYVSSVRYLPEVELRRLFRNAQLTYERVMGLKKSFYVYKTE